MTWLPIMAFTVVAVIYAVGDYVAVKTKGVISSVLVAIALLLVFGGTLRLLPENLMDLSGLSAMIPTFGMGLILVNVGSLMNLNDMRKEWKTVVISLAGIAGIILLDSTLGTAVFGRERALAAIPPTAGGAAVTMLMSEAANEAGRPDLASFVAAVTALQVLIGLPVASVCLRRAAKAFIAGGGHKREEKKVGKEISLRIVPELKGPLAVSSTMHFARLGVVAVAAQLCTNVTGISTGVTFLVFGIVAGALGIVEKGSLKTAGGEGILMLATYAYVASSFVSMKFSDFGELLVPVVGLLVIGAVGVMILSALVGKLLGWNPFLAIAVGVACLFGYPVTYAVAMEVAQGVTKGAGFTEAEEQRVVSYLLPKMLVAGVVSVSLTSVILGGIIAPMLF
ncbi:hypothetical protein [Lachnoclostridium sp. An14]|uniref:hypothetical protein n=1 Tax=Lachnoclostridium sp. An14 TaxID=1965562 RepID=UPI00117B07D3|nr:hypothetical protein [Lachnoclostridium sp. An14]